MRTIVIVAHCDDENDDRQRAEDAMVEACVQLEDVAAISVALTAPGEHRIGPEHGAMAEFMLAAANEESGVHG